MGEKKAIRPGETYWVVVDEVRFKVRAVRPSALPGWWLCETERMGDPVMVPEKHLAEDLESTL